MDFEHPLDQYGRYASEFCCSWNAKIFKNPNVFFIPTEEPYKEKHTVESL